MLTCRQAKSNQEALEKGLCRACNSYECLAIKDPEAHCYKCDSTGVVDIINDDLVICTKCFWGKQLEIEQYECTKISLEDLFLEGDEDE